MHTLEEIQTWEKSNATYQRGLRYTASDGTWIEIGNYCKIGNECKIGDYSKIEKTPLYLWPNGGNWPVYVSDAEKKMVGIGCEIHHIDWWLDGGAKKVREEHGMEGTSAIYDPALLAVQSLMGWLGK